MSLQFGGGRGANMLPSAGSRHRSAGPSLMACAGGLVSTGAGAPANKMRRYGGPMEKLSKESYALALEEQIASHKLKNASPVQAAPVLVEPPQPVERVMGQRYGGPMAPARKDSYASALLAQIEAKRAEIEESGKAHAFAAAPVEGFFGGAEAPVRHRRHGAPPVPSKQSYAISLQQQMKMRSVQQASEVSRIQESANCDEEEEVLDEVFGRGRRHGAPPLPPKNLYAVELQQQMAQRKAQELQAVVAQQPFLVSPGGHDAFSEQKERARGKRSQSESVSGARYNHDLQEQMAERAGQRAAAAFHVQAQVEAQHAGPFGQEDNRKVGRKKCEVPFLPSKEAYALALQEQMAERRAQQKSQCNDAPGQGAFVGGDASDEGPARGRRRVWQIAPSSKEELGSYLQRQMVEQARKEAENKLYNQAPARVEQGDPRADADALERLLGANAGHASCVY